MLVKLTRYTVFMFVSGMGRDVWDGHADNPEDACDLALASSMGAHDVNEQMIWIIATIEGDPPDITPHGYCEPDSRL